MSNPSITSASARPGALNMSRKRVGSRAFVESDWSSEDNLEPVIGGSDGQRRPLLRAADFFVAARLGQDFLEHLIVVCRLVMVHHQMLDAGELGKLDSDHIARMSPVLFHGNLV